MTQWIRWWGLGLFIAILLLAWLATNPLIKRGIEFAGTQAVGAKVELDGVTWRWGGPALTLDRLQVTNPEAPMSNLFEAGRMEFALDGWALLRRQFVAENLAVEDLAFNTPRAQSGAIERRIFARDRTDEEPDDFDITRLLPGLADMPDPGDLAAEGRENIERELDEIDNQGRAIETGWDEHIQRLPGSATVDGYRDRWRELQRRDPLRQAAGIRELTRDIDRDLDTIRSLDDRLQDDRQTLRELNRQARALPGRESRRLVSGMGLDDGLEGFTRALLGEELTGQVEQALAAYEFASTHLAGRKRDEPPRPPRGEGEYIRFPEEEPLPRFLIKRAAVNGVIEIAEQPIRFSGQIRDITHEPAVWGRPMTLAIEGGNEAGVELTVNGRFDHRDAPSRDELDFSLNGLAINNATLSDSSRLPIVLEQSRADITGNMVVTERRLDSSVNTRFEQARFSAGSADASGTVRRVANAIEGISAFRLDLGLGGTLRSPQISVNSDLDRIIMQALGDEVRRELAATREEVERRLRAEIKSELDALAAYEAQLEDFQRQIDERRQALRDIRP